MINEFRLLEDLHKHGVFVTQEVKELILNQPQIVGYKQPYIDRWIPCSERLPEDGQVVLANTLNQDKGINCGQPIIICEYHDCAYWHDGRIKAWMSLPENYKEEV